MYFDVNWDTAWDWLSIISNWNVWIWTILPWVKLHVAESGAGGANIRSSGPAADNNWAWGIEFLSNNATSVNAKINASVSWLFFNFGGSEKMRINSLWNVWIGTTNPWVKLEVAGSVRGNSNGWSLRIDTGNWYVDIGPQNANWSHFMTDRASFYFNKDVQSAVGFNAGYIWTWNTPAGGAIFSGDVWIGTSSPSYKLHVSWTAAWTSWTNLSDQRYKKNIETIENPLDIISKLRWVTFDWRKDEFKNKNFTSGQKVWFIAQEVEGVLPQVVTTDKEWYKWVEYANLTAVLVEAVKELKKQNEILKAEKDSEVKQLKGEIEKLKIR